MRENFDFTVGVHVSNGSAVLNYSRAAVRFSNLVAKASRRCADEAMKVLRQVALIAEAGSKRDLGDGDAIVGQQSFGQIDAPEHDIPV